MPLQLRSGEAPTANIYSRIDVTNKPFDMAVAQYNHAMGRGDYELAVRIIRPLAEAGDAGWQSALAAHYGAGWGLQRDESLALHWYRRCAEQGHLYGQYQLGCAYLCGVGGPQNHRLGVEFLEAAADQGLIQAQYALGVLFAGGGIAPVNKELFDQALRDGESVASYTRPDPSVAPVNHALSFTWMKKAADQGMPEAQFAVGEAYRKGEGVATDHRSALHWYLKGARQGLAAAQIAAGAAYRDGKGVKRDARLASKWLRKAAKQKQPTAQLVPRETPRL
jgi:TPR repeat protein